MSATVLVLNIDYTPLEVISWEEAIVKILQGKAELVEEYAGRMIRSARQAFPYPAVIRKTTGYIQSKVKLSRANVLARDSYTCQYCGVRPRKKTGTPQLEALTLDHVFPKSRAVNGWVPHIKTGKRVRATSWANLTAACKRCNADKANRTPKEAGLKLRSVPKAPSPVVIARMAIFKYRIPDEWKDYLPKDSPWAGYWDDELED